MNVTSKLKIDLLRKPAQLTVDAVQGDANSRYLAIALYTGANPWAIPEGTTAAVRYGKPDGTKGYYDTMPDGTPAWEIAENVITVQLAPQMLTVPGCVQAQVELLQEDTRLGVFAVQVVVEADPAAGVPKSEDYINWLHWMEQELQECLREAKESGDFNGPMGTPAQLVSWETAYQAGASGVTVPTGTWSADIPEVSPGQYLWTRTTQVFNSGDPVVAYSVSGSSAKITVNGIAPDAGGNVTLTAEDIDAATKAYVDRLYPVGAIYLSMVGTSPASFIGGTWERLKDTFLLAAGDTYAAGTTGGEAEHTLTADEMPSHSHKYRTTYGEAAAEATTNEKIQAGGDYNNYQFDQTSAIEATGGGKPHNNMPPYTAVYIWQRIA